MLLPGDTVTKGSTEPKSYNHLRAPQTDRLASKEMNNYTNSDNCLWLALGLAAPNEGREQSVWNSGCFYVWYYNKQEIAATMVQKRQGN